MTPKKETPTLKGVEEVMAEFMKSVGICTHKGLHIETTCTGLIHLASGDVPKLEEVVRTTLLTRDAAHEAQLREVVVKGKAIIITAELDRKFFKGRFSSSGLESIEKIIEETLTTPPTQEADQADYKE